MKKMKFKNPITIKIIIIVAAILFVTLITLLIVFSKPKNGKGVYLVDRDIKETSAELIKNYDAYKNFVEQNDIKMEFEESDFEKNYLFATFQEYDKCSEKEYKTLEGVEYLGNKMTITFTVHNKCGWCKAKTVLYLIKIDQIDDDTQIDYEYNYDHDSLDCGSIS